MNTVSISSKIEKELNKLVNHSINLERENSHLRNVIRILAESMALDENGNTTMQLSRESADYVKRTVGAFNVFMITNNGENNG